MSSLAFPRAAVPRRAHREGLTALIAERGYDIVLAAPIAVLAAVLLINLPGAFNVDSWLALVTGRAVWTGGIPHHETLTILAHGRAWVDQQWLSQLASYGLYLVGGLALLGMANVAMLVFGVGFAVLVGRRRGAPFLSALLCLPVCLAMITPSREVRTQEFAIPLFMALVYLLAQDSRRPSRRVFWCLPILILWANLHGTVTLGAGLVVLYGLSSLWEHRATLRTERQAWLRPMGLIVGAAVAILVTPYGLSMIGYYHTTMASSTLRHAVTEWQPVTAMPITAVALFIVAGAALWSFGRNPGKTTTWEKLAFVALAASAIAVNRNALFLGLFALMIVPVSLALGSPDAGARSSSGSSSVRALINGSIGATALLVLVLALAVTALRPDSRIEYGFQRSGVLTAVQAAVRADPGLRVMPDERFTDWLLWRDPALAGRVAYDVRYELLNPGQLQGLTTLFTVGSAGWKTAAHGYRLLVLSRQYDPAAFVAFRSEPGARVLYNDGQRMVLLRSAVQAGRN